MTKLVDLTKQLQFQATAIYSNLHTYFGPAYDTSLINICSKYIEN